MTYNQSLLFIISTSGNEIAYSTRVYYHAQICIHTSCSIQNVLHKSLDLLWRSTSEMYNSQVWQGGEAQGNRAGNINMMLPYIPPWLTGSDMFKGNAQTTFSLSSDMCLSRQ